MATIFPILFSLTFFWFLIASVVFIVLLISSSRIQDLEERKRTRKKHLKIVLYPILTFFVIVVLQALMVIAGR